MFSALGSVKAVKTSTQTVAKQEMPTRGVEQDILTLSTETNRGGLVAITYSPKKANAVHPDLQVWHDTITTAMTDVLVLLGVDDIFKYNVGVDENGQFHADTMFLYSKDDQDNLESVREAIADALNKKTVNGTPLGEMILNWQDALKSPESSPAKPSNAEPLNKSALFQLPTFLTNPLTTQKASSPVEKIMKDLNRMLLAGAMTQVMRASGVELKEGDVISMSLNGKGEFSVNASGSSINGKTGDEISELCGALSNQLNETETSDGGSLGKAVLQMFAADMGFDFNEVWGDENFSVSFSFKYDGKKGRNDFSGATLNGTNLQMLDMLSIQQDDTKDKTGILSDTVVTPAQARGLDRDTLVN
jgi:hypothetical protein